MTKLSKYTVEPPSISRSTLWRSLALHHARHRRCCVPIEDGVSEGTCRAGASEEGVPDGVSKSAGLGGRGEASSASGTAETDGDHLSLGLAGLDSRGEEGTVWQLSTREGRVSSNATDLHARDELTGAGGS